MEPHGRRVAFAAAAVIGALSVSAVGAAGVSPHGAQAKKCPAGKVPVTIRGRTACQPLNAALPSPRVGDKRAALLRTALTPHWGGPFKRGKKIPTPAAVLGKKHHRALQRAIPEVLGRLDSLASYRLLVLYAKPGCMESPPDAPAVPTKTDKMTRDLGGGAKLDARLSFGADGAGVEIGLTGKQKDGGSVRFSAKLSLCDEDGLHVPSCATAEGVLEGTDGARGTITIEQRAADGDLEFRESIKVNLQIKLRGQTADDAKLDTLKIDVYERYDVALRRNYLPLVRLSANQTITITRSTVVDMRTGAYRPGESSVSVPQQRFGGILSLIVNEASWRQKAIEQWKKASDESLANAVDAAIRDYQARETAWQTPNTCATMDLSPPSETLAPLRRHQTGQVGGKMVAKADGGVSPGRWTVANQENGTFAPVATSGTQPTFAYTVTHAGNGVLLAALFKATSKAGVADASWKQRTFGLPDRIRGTFSGKRSTQNVAEDSELRWTGTVTFVRVSEPPGPVYYTAERADFTSTLVFRSPCGASDTQSGSVDQGGLLTLTVDETLGPKPYEITAQFVREDAGEITCVLTQPWVVASFLITGAGHTYGDDFVLRGSFERDYGSGMRETQSWDLAPIG